MTDYIKKIVNNNTTYTLGGTALDGSFSYLTTDHPSLENGGTQANVLISGYSLSAGGYKTASVANLIPDDGYDYEILLHVYTVQATSGKYSLVRLYSGDSTDFQNATGTWQNVGMRTARTSANYRVAQTVWVPISASDKNITIAQGSDTGTTTCTVYYHGYRRIGTNGYPRFSTSSLSSNLSSNNWYGITYDGSKFIAITNGGYISTSTDGEIWTTPVQTSELGNNSWREITYVGSVSTVFGASVALSLTGKIAYSYNQDYTTWYMAEDLGSNSWYGLAYKRDDSNGEVKFVCLGNTGYLSTSTNLMGWSTPSQNSNLSSQSGWRGLIYARGKFIALTLNGYISTSTDGTTWSAPVQNTNLGSHSWNSIVYGNGMFVAIGAAGYISRSWDGIHWTPAIQDVNLGSHSFYASTFGNETFVILGNTGYVSTSNVIKNINSATIGGDIVDGTWVISHYDLSGTITMTKNSIRTFSLENYLPDDGYDYMVSISGYGRTQSGSGAAYYYIMPGTQTYDTVIRYGCSFMMTEYHSTSTYACSGNLMLPVYANDRNVTLANYAGYTTGNTAISAVAYRRIGTNG